MLKYVPISILLFASSLNCRQKQSSIQIPDMGPSFKRQLYKADSTLVVDSFYLIGMDTMSDKTSLLHIRFPYFHILARLDKQIDSLRNIDSTKNKPAIDDLQKMKDLNEEREFVRKEIDSLNTLLMSADSVKPIGYRAIFKVTVHKPKSFIISDTIAYSLSTKMELSDWDRNVGKAIDSISVGRHVVESSFNIKRPIEH